MKRMMKKSRAIWNESRPPSFFLEIKSQFERRRLGACFEKGVTAIVLTDGGYALLQTSNTFFVYIAILTVAPIGDLLFGAVAPQLSLFSIYLKCFLFRAKKVGAFVYIQTWQIKGERRLSLMG